jgi:hypothetical protein
LGRTELSTRELGRVEVMGRVKARSLRLCEAAEMLGLSYRQSKRIWARYENSCPLGGMVIPHAGDISIVQRTGTFLLWYDI